MSEPKPASLPNDQASAARAIRPGAGRWLRRYVRTSLERVVFYQPLFLMGAALLIGVLCGGAAVGFHHLIHAFQRLFWGLDDFTVEGIRALSWWTLALAPALGGLLVAPVIRFLAPEAKGHGVPEVMLAVARHNGLMRGRVVIGKALASALTLASGGSAGREGPIIQIGAALGSKVGQLLRASGQHVRTFAGCGAAAGLAATFNAPIAATLFTVEVIIGEYSVLQFTPIVISAVIATVISRSYWGNEPVFRVPDYELVSAWEFGPYLLLGLISGGMAIALIRLLFHAEDRFEAWRFPAWLKPAAGGLAVGVIGIGLPHVFSDGYDTVDAVLQGGLAGWLVLLLLLAKLLATSLTLGSGGSGGVFMPSLFLGALTGSTIGQFSGWLLGDLAGNPGGYALVGMGGIVAGAMHAPITAMIMMFELTGNYAIVLPLMIVCIVSTMVTHLVQRESIYTGKLARQGIDLFRGRTLDIFREIRVADCQRKDPPTIPGSTPATRVIASMLELEGSTLYVIDEQGGLHGTIRLHDLKHLLTRPGALEHGLLALDLADTGAPVCHPEESLSDALVKFERSGMTELPVVTPGDGRLVACLPYAELIAHYNEEVFRRDSGETLAHRLAATRKPDNVAIAPGVSVRTWRPPPVFWGKSLAEAELPLRYHVQVVLIRRNAEPVPGSDEAEIIALPDRDYLIGSRDLIVVCGRDADLSGLPGA